MSVRTAPCPGCGATLEFHNAATLFVVCPYCGGASSRGDVRLELLGKVAAVADLESVLSIGAVGTLGGSPDRAGKRWRAVGQIQLDHGLGPWNEWCLAFEDDTWAWLAEAQGELLLTREAKGASAPPHAALDAGETVDLGEHGKWVVAEVGVGKVTAVKGELPVPVKPGAKVRYADVRSPNGGFGTLDYGSDGDDLDAAYLGFVVEVEALGIDETSVERKAPKAVEAKRLQCPKCGQTIDVRDPRNAVRVVCGACGAMLDPRESNLKVLEIAAQLKASPSIPLGAKGLLDGQSVEVLAFLVRSVRVEGIRYAWREYLLKTGRGGYRWLVESNGHWNHVVPASLGDARRAGLTATWKGVEFRHFQAGRARVDHVQGEVYWEVSVGEEVQTDDFVAPPRMLSLEGTGKERVVSVGTYLPREEVAAAFALATPLPVPTGISPNQPNPWVGAGRFWGAFGLLAAATIVLMIAFHARAAKAVVFDRSLAVGGPKPAVGGAAPAVDPASDVVFSDEFDLAPSSSDVAVDLRLVDDNAWVGVDGSLVNVETGEVHAFEVDAQKWSGVDGGESWSEGSGRGTVYLSEVPRGRYALRLEPTTSGSSVRVDYRLKVTNQVASSWRVLWLLLALSVVPLWRWILSRSFEARRWAESDHASGGGSDDEEEDDA
jgi:hypothetical protein